MKKLCYYSWKNMGNLTVLLKYSRMPFWNSQITNNYNNKQITTNCSYCLVIFHKISLPNILIYDLTSSPVSYIKISFLNMVLLSQRIFSLFNYAHLRKVIRGVCLPRIGSLLISSVCYKLLSSHCSGLLVFITLPLKHKNLPVFNVLSDTRQF